MRVAVDHGAETEVETVENEREKRGENEDVNGIDRAVAVDRDHEAAEVVIVKAGHAV